MSKLCITRRVIVNFRKTAANPLYQLHLLVNIPQDGNDLQSYAQNFTGNYIVIYGIIGNVNDVDADKVYDYHTAFNIEPTKVKVNVPLDMNNKKITKVKLDESDNNSVPNIQYVKNIDVRLTTQISSLSQNTNNKVYRKNFEHFYDSREVSSLNLISHVSGVVINEINPNPFLGFNRNTKDYNSKYGLKFSRKSHILTHIINKNTAYTIFISFIHDGK